ATRPEDEAAQTAMPFTDVLFFSSDGGDTGALREQMRDYHARGPRLVVAMLGEKGSLCFDGERFHSFGIVPCEKLVDTMGAGDSYIAGFLFGLVEGLPLEDCMAKGAANAAVTLGYFGGW
ncbi:MAG: fructoselysine 6-kinase, partial [Clostridia bacterium]|nr:fructoselysine 6-kinase [Clostridia bacterium]